MRELSPQATEGEKKYRNFVPDREFSQHFVSPSGSSSHLPHQREAWCAATSNSTINRKWMLREGLAEGSRTMIGFRWLLSANTAENPSKISTDILFGILLVLPKSSSAKIALHLSARGFAEVFGAADAALLTQGKDNKAKRSQKIC